MERSLLDMELSEIDFGSIDAITELRKINPKFMQGFDKLNGKDRITFVRSYEQPSPVEAQLLQMVLDKIEMPKVTLTEESKVRREMAEAAAKGHEIDTPEAEKEWEAKIQAARLLDEKRREEIKESRKITAKVQTESPDDALSAVKGLGEKSIAKLVNAGVRTASEFMALSPDQKEAIVGPVVAVNFK